MRIAGRPNVLYTSIFLILISSIQYSETTTTPTTKTTLTTISSSTTVESNDSGLPTTNNQDKSSTIAPSLTTSTTMSAGTTNSSNGSPGASTTETTITTSNTTSNTAPGTFTTPPQSNETKSSPGSSTGTPSTSAPTTLSPSSASQTTNNQTVTTNPTESTQVTKTTISNNVSVVTGSTTPSTTSSAVTSTSLSTTPIAATTQTPTTAAPGTTTNGSVTVAPGTTTNGSVTVVTNSSPTSVTNTTVQAASTSTIGTTSTTVAATTPLPSSTTPQSTGSTSKPTTVKPSTSMPGDHLVYINEIMVDKQGIFQTIEIQLSNQQDFSHYAILMVDGGTSKINSVIYLNSSSRLDNGLLIVQYNSSSVLPSKGMGIAIYDTNQIAGGFTSDWVLSTKGVVDALVIGKTYEGVSALLIDVLTPGVNPFILDPSKYGKAMTISRCSTDFLRSTEMYALIHPSMGKLNNDKCKDRQHYQNTLSVKIKLIDCGLFKMADNKINKTLLNDVMKLVVMQVNKRCKCGITRMHVIDPTIQCCEGTTIQMKFVAPNKTQDDEYLNSFKSFIKDTSSISIQGTSYSLDQSCLNDCCKQVVGPISKKDNSHNIKVSVAVIVTLLVLFLIIVFVVCMYMRKKKYAVQQFRMSRLEEDEEDFDDMTVGINTDDQDEFVGGQEATFDRRA